MADLVVSSLNLLRKQTVMDRLAMMGCVFAAVTSEWEVFRCRHPDGTWHILYRNKHDRLTWSKELMDLLRPDGRRHSRTDQAHDL